MVFSVSDRLVINSVFSFHLPSRYSSPHGPEVLFQIWRSVFFLFRVFLFRPIMLFRKFSDLGFIIRDLVFSVPNLVFRYFFFSSAIPCSSVPSFATCLIYSKLFGPTLHKFPLLTRSHKTQFDKFC